MSNGLIFVDVSYNSIQDSGFAYMFTSFSKSTSLQFFSAVGNEGNKLRRILSVRLIALTFICNNHPTFSIKIGEVRSKCD